MKNELISLLLKAYDDGIVTSIILTKILKAKEVLNISDEEFRKLDDQIRIETYLKKVEERKQKGVVYFGDLTKQYRITEEDKILLQEIRSVKPTSSLLFEEPTQPAEVVTAKPKPAPSTKQAKQFAEQKPAAQTKPTKQPAEVTSQVPNGDFVLVVDDNPNLVKFAKTLLEKNGYVCCTAECPESALKLAIQKKPLLILCDFNFGIGKRTGLDLFHELKDRKIIVPFIILSAYFQKEFVDYAFGIGVTDYLTKPVEPETLLSTVKEHFPVKK